MKVGQPVKMMAWFLEKCHLDNSKSRLKHEPLIFGLFCLPARALLSDWMNTKLRQELEMEEDDDLMNTTERTSPVALATAQPNALDFSNFDGTEDGIVLRMALTRG